MNISAKFFLILSIAASISCTWNHDFRAREQPEHFRHEPHPAVISKNMNEPAQLAHAYENYSQEI